jgi:tRNA (guanine-N7-)-methyltransferase
LASTLGKLNNKWLGVKLKWSNPYALKLNDFQNNIFQINKDQDIARVTKQVQEIISGRTSVIVEIGSGSGNFIVQLANENKDKIFFGFELRYNRAYRSAEKAKKLKLNNIYIIRHDVKNINLFFNANQIDQVIINFPDPWDKRRTKYKRTLNENFLNTLYDLLKYQGLIKFKTDHRDYFDEFIGKIIIDERFSLVQCTYDLHQSGYKHSNILTEFEEMFIREKKQICFCTVKRN